MTVAARGRGDPSRGARGMAQASLRRAFRARRMFKGDAGSVGPQPRSSQGDNRRLAGVQSSPRGFARAIGFVSSTCSCRAAALIATMPLTFDGAGCHEWSTELSCANTVVGLMDQGRA